MPLPIMRFPLCALSLLSFSLTVHHAQAENWPRFRGPTGQGISAETSLPLHWSATENVAWKTETPGDGWSSPVIWNDRVFLTSTTDEGRSCHVLAVDRKSGRLLWNTKVFEQTPTKKRAENSYSTPTPVTDGEMVFAVFSDGSLAGLGVDGKLAWTNRDYPFYSHHGLSASPIMFEDLVIMAFDGSSGGEDNRIGWKVPWEKAVLVALDRKSGKVRWEGKRGPSRIAHVTPNLLRANGHTQIVSAAGDVIQGFNAETGERLWSVFSQGEGVTPSVVVGDGVLFTCSGFEEPTIRVVKTDGTGDVTTTHIAWEQKRGVPSLASLLYVEPYLYSATIDGVVTCFAAGTGELLSQKRIGGKYSASPVYADGRIYFLDENEGLTTVVEPGPELNVLATNPLGEKCQASMAVSQGQFIIRTEKHLFCIGADSGK